MFFVFNKEKIYSYIIAVSMVIILFAVSTIYLENENVIETSSNVINENLMQTNMTENKFNNVL